MIAPLSLKMWTTGWKCHYVFKPGMWRCYGNKTACKDRWQRHTNRVKLFLGEQYLCEEEKLLKTVNNHILPLQRFRTSRQTRTPWRSSPVWAAWGTSHDAADHTCLPEVQQELTSHYWGPTDRNRKWAESEICPIPIGQGAFCYSFCDEQKAFCMLLMQPRCLRFKTLWSYWNRLSIMRNSNQKSTYIVFIFPLFSQMR